MADFQICLLKTASSAVMKLEFLKRSYWYREIYSLDITNNSSCAAVQEEDY